MTLIRRLVEASQAAHSMPSELLEELAAHAHRTWASWAHYMIDNWDEEHKMEWLRQISTPYENLSEKEKTSDRAIAEQWMFRLLASMTKLDISFSTSVLYRILTGDGYRGEAE